MVEKKVLREVRGTIINIYDYPVIEALTGKVLSREKVIVIESDDKENGTITESFVGRDYSHFSVGQRIVHVTYTWKGQPTAGERYEYISNGLTCPNEVDKFEYITYDELTYDQQKQSSKTR